MVSLIKSCPSTCRFRSCSGSATRLPWTKGNHGNAQLQFLGTMIILGMMMTSCVLRNFDDKENQEKLERQERKAQGQSEHHTFHAYERDSSYSDSSVRNISIMRLPKF